MEKAGLKLNIKKSKDHGIWFHHFVANKWGKVKAMTDFIFLDTKSLRMVSVDMTLKDAWSWKESDDKPIHCIRRQRHHFADKDMYSQSYGFSSSHVLRPQGDQASES